MEVSVDVMGVVTWQHVSASNQHAVHLKSTQRLCQVHLKTAGGKGEKQALTDKQTDR